MPKGWSSPTPTSLGFDQPSSKRKTETKIQLYYLGWVRGKYFRKRKELHCNTRPQCTEMARLQIAGMRELHIACDGRIKYYVTLNPMFLVMERAESSWLC